MSEDIYADIRAAYNLIYDYHGRARDTIKLFADRFGTRAPYRHYKRVSGLGGRMADPLALDRWTWDFLPHHSAVYFFLNDGADEIPVAGDRMLSVHHCTDTAIFDPNGPLGRGEPEPAPGGRTGCLFVVYSLTEEKTDWTWREIWDSNKWTVAGDGKTKISYHDDTCPKLDAVQLFVKFSRLETEEAIVREAGRLKDLADEHLKPLPGSST